MAKQFASFHVSWRDARPRRLGLFPDDSDYARAAARALEAKLNDLAQDGWIVDRVLPATGLTARQSAAFTIIAFR
jgi:hypothetical protein